jgi:hypothetical protein
MSKNLKYSIILHILNLLVGFGLFFIFFHQNVLSYFISFVFSYALFFWLLITLYRITKSRILRYGYCLVFIYLVGGFAMFFHFVFILDVWHINFFILIAGALGFAFYLLSLGVIILLWPVCIVLSIVNYFLLSKLTFTKHKN